MVAEADLAGAQGVSAGVRHASARGHAAAPGFA
jgi:hypothetical protein